jgi:hypothetical protein
MPVVLKGLMAGVHWPRPNKVPLKAYYWNQWAAGGGVQRLISQDIVKRPQKFCVVNRFSLQ